MKEVFACRMCGNCCEGRGGIVLSHSDLLRLADYVGIGLAEFADFYGEERNGKLTMRADDDGFCVFFRHNAGCGVHPARPNICRAWPFFKGNLSDPLSLEMAREACPGIADVSFEEFRQAGLNYLREQGLLADLDDAALPNALKIEK